MDLKSSSKTFPGFDQIYLMGSTGSDRMFIGRLEPPEECGPFDLLRGECVPSETVDVSWAMGRNHPSDVIWTTRVGTVVVSAKVISLLQASSFTGWSTYPVVVKNKNGDVVDGYVGLSVTGRCGEIDDSRCERVEREFPGGVFPMYRGLYFDDSQWDGTDIFCSANRTGYVFVTHAVKLAFEQAKFRNVRFEAASAIERSTL